MRTAAEAEVLEVFRAFLDAQKFSPVTIRNYCSFAAPFIKEEASQEWVNLYIRRHNHALARSMLRQFLKCFQLQLEIPKLKGKHGEPITRWLTIEEVHKLINEFPNPKYSALVMLLFDTGLRISEALALTPLHVDWERNIIRGIGKGHKQYEVIISNDTAEVLMALAEFMLKEDERFFRMGVRSVENYFKLHGRQILNKHLNPHQLRHSIAMHLKRNRMPIEDIKEYLRHSNIATTNRYAHAESKEKVIQNIRDLFARGS